MAADLFAQLTTASRSLAAQRVASSTASNNIENASTPGYARQRANLVALGGVQDGNSILGLGVDVSSVTQVRDRFIENQMPGALAAAGAADARQSVLTPVAALDPSGPGTLTDAMGSFFASLRTVAVDPTQAGAREAAVAAARTLAHTFQSAAADIDGQRRGIDSDLQGNVDQVNQLSAQVATLNAQIRAQSAGGNSPNDLLDARQSALDSLAEKTGGSVLIDAQGNANVQLPSGAPLVIGDHAATLSAIPDGANGGHLKLQISATDSSAAPPHDVAFASGAGTIGGLLQARDVDLKSAANNVDNLAFNLATSLNTIHQAGFAEDGSSGRTLFDIPATAAGAASSIAVNAQVNADPTLLAASSAGSAGDGVQAQALAAVETSALSTGQTPTDALAQMVSSFGTSAAQAANDQATADASKSSLTSLRESTSGVSIDEEMVELTKAQRAFEASTKVIQTADQMLQSLLAIAGTP
ncbi:MAG TPA: flagellar hook-associated protein FlgK [Myxococcota bacterium]|jgi:flagellar hook-associated protein 1 FlgK